MAGNNAQSTDRLIEVTKAAFSDAGGTQGAWADAVDEALARAGYSVLSAVEYGAEVDTDLVAVVEVGWRPIGIWHSDGRWVTGAIEVPA